MVCIWILWKRDFKIDEGIELGDCDYGNKWFGTRYKGVSKLEDEDTGNIGH